MGKSKVHMPKELEKKCHIAIPSAATTAAAAGAISIPMSDAIPITGAQIAMIVAIGKIFDVTLTDAAAKSMLGVTLARQAGRTIFTSVLKLVPGAGQVAGGIIGALTAATLTETLGWMIADDFFRVMSGENPVDIPGAADMLKGAFNGLNWSK